MISKTIGTAENLFRKGVELGQQGLKDQALSHYIQAIALKPDFFEAHYNSAIIYRDGNKTELALRSFLQCATIKPDADTYINMGPLFHSLGMFKEALNYYKHALAFKPNHVDTMNNLGALYSQLGLYEEALILHENVLASAPDDLRTINNLGILYKSTGQLGKAIAQYRRGLEIDSDNISFFSNMLLAMVYSADVSPQELYQTAREFGDRVAAPLRRSRLLNIDKNLERRLRVGYVSPDFRNHAVNYFFENLLKNHNRDEFEIYAYSNSIIEDAVTERLKGEFDHWRNIAEKNDDEAADIIETDKIDILVDITGHTAKNRLLVFARKPAPIQVTWLGYPATTGVQAIDYRITDIYSEPEGMTEHLNVETLWRLPDIFCCYGAHESNPAVIDAPPFEDNGYITFGCFNNFTKVTDDVLKTWAYILNQVPNCRLLLEIVGIDGPRYKKETENRIRASGLPLEKIIFQPRRKENQFILYNKIDIALDPFPCAGGTTSMDTMWMGVPFITLAGRHFVSRMGVTILTNVGLQELIAQNINEYIQKAVDLARDHDRLRAIRHNLRERVLSSPLMDQETFTRNMENSYREMWRKWCLTH